MTQFSDRIEGEIKSHEKEMIRKAIIKKYGDKDLTERIHFVMSTYEKDHWSEEEMLEKLTELGLKGTESINEIKNIFSDSSFAFSSKVG